MREIKFKDWLDREARRLSVKRCVIISRYYRGDYGALSLRRVNGRVVFVRLNAHGHAIQGEPSSAPVVRHRKANGIPGSSGRFTSPFDFEAESAPATGHGSLQVLEARLAAL